MDRELLHQQQSVGPQRHKQKHLCGRTPAAFISPAVLEGVKDAEKGSAQLFKLRANSQEASVFDPRVKGNPFLLFDTW